MPATLWTLLFSFNCEEYLRRTATFYVSGANHHSLFAEETKSMFYRILTQHWYVLCTMGSRMLCTHFGSLLKCVEIEKEVNDGC